MARPLILQIAINVHDQDAEPEYYKRVFGLEEKQPGSNGTIYLSDGFVRLAQIRNPDISWGLNHFGFQVESIKAIEDTAATTAIPNTAAAVGESLIRNVEGNRMDLSEYGWPI